MNFPLSDHVKTYHPFFHPSAAAGPFSVITQRGSGSGSNGWPEEVGGSGFHSLARAHAPFHGPNLQSLSHPGPGHNAHHGGQAPSPPGPHPAHPSHVVHSAPLFVSAASTSALAAHSGAPPASALSAVLGDVAGPSAAGPHGPHGEADVDQFLHNISAAFGWDETKLESEFDKVHMHMHGH